jgi:hypothetical protein
LLVAVACLLGSVVVVVVVVVLWLFVVCLEGKCEVTELAGWKET